jgi:hypothetical protein
VELLESIADRIGLDYQKGPLQKRQKTDNADNDMVRPFSISYEHLKHNPRPVDVFVYFFEKEAKLGYYSELKCAKLKSDESKRKQLIAKFARVKKITRLMLMNLGFHPGKKPMDPKELTAWEANLLQLGRQAEQNIYAYFNGKVEFEKFNVTNVLTNKEACKQMQHDLRLPANTPVEEYQFFNT